MRFVFIIMVLVLTALMGCKTKDKKNNGKVITEMVFAVDTNLIGKTLFDSSSKLLINLPKHYSKMLISKSSMDSLSAKKIKVAAALKSDSGNTSFLILDFNQLSNNSFEKYTKNIKDGYNEQIGAKQAIISIDDFVSNKIFFKQLMIKTLTHIIFKIIILNNFLAKYEIDFIIPKTEFEKQGKVVESVIGSITIK